MSLPNKLIFTRARLCLFAIILTTFFAMPAVVHASADGCVSNPGFNPSPESCMDVRGNKRSIEKIRGGVALFAGAAATGYFSISLPDGTVIKTNEALYDNRRGLVEHKKWAPWIAINRKLSKGGKACAAFIENVGGRYVAHSSACIQVKG
jgi:hypothetical protein